MKQFFGTLLIILTFYSCKNKQEKTQATVEDISESVYASGIVKSKNQYQVFSTVNGIIQDILVNEGELVNKGTPIIRILNESSKLNAENAKLAADLAAANTDKLNELKANIDLVKAKLNNDSMLFTRQKKLWDQQVGTLYELEQRELNYKNTKTNYDVALLRYNDAKKQFNFSARQTGNNLQISTAFENDFVIRSETDGKLYAILKEKGELVNPLSPVAVIGSANDFVLELQVDENDITKIKTGQKIMLTLNSYKDQTFEARVEKVNTIMNERSRSFTVEAVFVLKPPTLFANLSVEANIILQTKGKALTIPRSYLIDETYVLNENGEKVKVKVGLKDYQKVEILEGISANDVVIKELK